jgi:hypothetical protein
MGQIIDIVGRKFGRLTVKSRAGLVTRGMTWVCECECGSTVTALGADLRGGNTKSCGCLQREAAANTGRASRTHGHTVGARTPEYISWVSMWSRCTDPKATGYENYGGRGITVCERWKSFENFLSDMGPRPKGMTLDRERVNEGYKPSNCRWATDLEQSNNARQVVYLTLGEKTMSKSAWARETGISLPTLNSRLKKGWSVEKALTEPVDETRRNHGISA